MKHFSFRWYLTRVTLNAKIPSAVQISIRTQGWDCETVGTVKPSRHIRIVEDATMKQSGSWNNQATRNVASCMDKGNDWFVETSDIILEYFWSCTPYELSRLGRVSSFPWFLSIAKTPPQLGDPPRECKSTSDWRYRRVLSYWNTRSLVTLKLQSIYVGVIIWQNRGLSATLQYLHS